MSHYDLPRGHWGTGALDGGARGRPAVASIRTVWCLTVAEAALAWCMVYEYDTLYLF
jgi:hypothetical protein